PALCTGLLLTPNSGAPVRPRNSSDAMIFLFIRLSPRLFLTQRPGAQRTHRSVDVECGCLHEEWLLRAGQRELCKAEQRHAVLHVSQSRQKLMKFDRRTRIVVGPGRSDRTGRTMLIRASAGNACRSLVLVGFMSFDRRV